MWDEVAREVEQLPSAVLTTVDAEGYPVSIRCPARFTASRGAVEVVVPPGLEVTPGPANLLWHRHDRKLWNLREFVVQGDLVRGANGWTLQPSRLLQGQGSGGLLGQLRSILRFRRTAAGYLAKRGLSRPVVDWDSINRLHDEANAMERHG